MDYSSLVDLLTRTIISSVETMIGRAQFDRTSIGVVTKTFEGGYTVSAFGGSYNVGSSLPLSVGDKVAVTAPQNNFKKLFLQKL